MNFSAPKFLITASFSALLLTVPGHCTHINDDAEEKSSPRLLSHPLNSSDGWSSDDGASLRLADFGEDTDSIPPLKALPTKNVTLTLDLTHLQRLNSSVDAKSSDTNQEEESKPIVFSARLIMPQGSTKSTPVSVTNQFSETPEDDSFEDMADDLEGALNRLSLHNNEPKELYELSASVEQEKEPALALAHTLDTFSMGRLPTELPLETELPSNHSHRHLSPPSNMLSKMIEAARDERSLADLRIFYGRQAIMFLMTDNSVSQSFVGNKDLELHNLIVLLSTLNDPYATFRLAEFQLKSNCNSPKTSSTHDPRTQMDNANETFTQALNLLLENYTPEADNVYLFNSMRTIVTEAAISNRSLDMGFFSLLTAFIEKAELGEFSKKPQLSKELKKVVEFCTSRFKLAQSTKELS